MSWVVTALDSVAQEACACSSWLKHWENASGLKATRCPVLDCLNTDLLGSHVQMAGTLGEICYLIPLCRHHHQCPHELEVAEVYPLVSALEACQPPSV